VGCVLCTTLSENPEHGGKACSCEMMGTRQLASPHGCCNAERCLPRHVAGDGALSCAQSCRPRRPQCPKRASARRPALSAPCRRPPSSPEALWPLHSGRCMSCGPTRCPCRRSPSRMSCWRSSSSSSPPKSAVARHVLDARLSDEDRGVAAHAVAASALPLRLLDQQRRRRGPHSPPSGRPQRGCRGYICPPGARALYSTRAPTSETTRAS